jgi:hypothetical protein
MAHNGFATDQGRAGQAGTKPVGDGAIAVAESARQQLMNASELLKTTIIQYPAAALGAALATGVLLGWLIKRR